MDREEDLRVSQRSFSLLLFLVPQAARNVREALRCARASVSDDASADVTELFAQQEALLSKLCKAIEAMGRGIWDLANERLMELTAECDELRRRSDRDFNRERYKRWANKLNEAVLRAAENSRSNEAIAETLERLEDLSDGGDHGSEGK